MRSFLPSRGLSRAAQLFFFPFPFATYRYGSSSSEESTHRSNRSASAPGMQEVQSAFHALGLSSSATFVDIRKRFIALAKENHPDVVCPFAAAERQQEQQRQSPPSTCPLTSASSSCSVNGDGFQRPGEAQATQRMIAINEAYHTLHLAHRAGLLSQSAHSTPNNGNGNSNTPRSSESCASHARTNGQRPTERHNSHDRNESSTAHRSATEGSSNGESGDPHSYHYRSERTTSSARNGSRSSPGSTSSSSQSSSASSAHPSSRTPFIRSDSSRRSLRFLYNESTPVIRNPFVELKEDEAPNFAGYYYDRTYAQVVAGKTITTTFDAASKRFTLVFRADPMMELTVTRIIIHFDLHYPQGIAVEISCSAPVAKGKISWKQVGKDCVEVSHDRVAVGLARHTVTVKIEPIRVVRQ